MKNLSRLTCSSYICKALISSVFLLFLFFPAKADSQNLIITELMYNLEGKDNLHEWVEIYNRGKEDIILLGGHSPGSWRFNDGKNHLLNIEALTISPGQYFILADDAQTFLADHPGFKGVVIDTVMSLKNTSETLKLIDGEGKEVENVTYQNSWGGNGNGKSLEKIDVNKNNEASNWKESLVLGGTPGSLNSVSVQLASIEPEPKQEISPEVKSESTPQDSPNIVSSPVREAKQILSLLIALSIAIFSGIIILILKRKMKIK
ncbi:MAG: lamin tail domain-containing protein [Patescibacteria group bacterium]|nr:lamin tail domain-containing protein [Patescibacteria group bacterium]